MLMFSDKLWLNYYSAPDLDMIINLDHLDMVLFGDLCSHK